MCTVITGRMVQRIFGLQASTPPNLVVDVEFLVSIFGGCIFGGIADCAAAVETGMSHNNEIVSRSAVKLIDHRGINHRN